MEKEEILKRKLIRLLSVLLAAGFLLSTTTAFAAEGKADEAERKIKASLASKTGAEVRTGGEGVLTKEGNKNGRSGKGKSLKYEYDYDDDFIRITSPKEGAVYYRGETMTVGFSAYSTWVEYDTVSVAGIFRTTDSTMFYRDSIYIYNDDLSWHSSSGKYNTSKLSNGSYTVDVFNFAYDPYYDELYDFDNMPYQYNTFTVKTLKAPGSLKTKVGKKKVKLTFAKASGATKYEIYRSTKKNKGFKKIATVSGNTYKDKKVKRKKIYYYKVKSVRTGRGTVRSGFSKTVKTKKVK